MCRYSCLQVAQSGLYIIKFWLMQYNFLPLHVSITFLHRIARPCPKLCLNTHKGCLAPLLALSDDLSR